MQNMVIYHGGCWDGFCAAWLIHRFGGYSDVEYYPAMYGKPPPDVTGRQVLMLDFSYPREVLEQMHEKSSGLFVLDHHKTAQAALEGLSYCEFDMDRSGAQLTWDWLVECHGDDLPKRPWTVDYTADRDLWRWKLPHSKEINAVLRSYPLDFDIWDGFDLMGEPSGLVRDGEAILRAEEVTVQVHIDRAQEVDFDGYKVLSVNATSLFSEIAGRLAEGRPFGVCWFEHDGMRTYSLRSREGGVDVSEIAKAAGGGGHKLAAGFEVPL
jgi:uncharacterized protein